MPFTGFFTWRKTGLRLHKGGQETAGPGERVGWVDGSLISGVALIEHRKGLEIAFSVGKCFPFDPRFLQH